MIKTITLPLTAKYRAVRAKRDKLINAFLIKEVIKPEKVIKKKKKKTQYPKGFYSYHTRETVLNLQSGECLLVSDLCRGSNGFHHKDEDIYNNTIANLAYMCWMHHTGVHAGIYKI